MKFSKLVVLLTFTAIGIAHSKPVSVVRHLPGYRCAALKLTPQQMMDPSVAVPVFSQPDAASAKLGKASATIAVSNPAIVSNGFVRMLFPSGKVGWVSAALLRPWQGAAGTAGTCAPAQLSNGRLGFDYAE